MTRARIVKVSALVAGATFALTGCGLHPGAAAVVGDETISGGEVDDAAGALCAANLSAAEARGEAKPDLASRGARQGALQILVDSELSRQFGEEQGVEPDQAEVSSALQQNAQNIDLLPEDQKDNFRSILRGYAEGQLMLIEIGRDALGQQSAPNDAAVAEGTRLRNEWASNVDIEVDPRYGSYAQGALNPTSGSLSIPASEGARAGAAAEPPVDWVAGLPLSQKCS